MVTKIFTTALFTITSGILPKFLPDLLIVNLYTLTNILKGTYKHIYKWVNKII